jgi:hypothetical protein
MKQFLINLWDEYWLYTLALILCMALYIVMPSGFWKGAVFGLTYATGYGIGRIVEYRVSEKWRDSARFWQLKCLSTQMRLPSRDSKGRFKGKGQ